MPKNGRDSAVRTTIIRANFGAGVGQGGAGECGAAERLRNLCAIRGGGHHCTCNGRRFAGSYQFLDGGVYSIARRVCLVLCTGQSHAAFAGVGRGLFEHYRIVCGGVLIGRKKQPALRNGEVQAAFVQGWAGIISDTIL